MFLKRLKKKFKDKRVKKEIENQVKEIMKADKIIPEFRTKQEKKEYEEFMKQAIGEDIYEEEKGFEKQVNRNLMGSELEKRGMVEEAIKLYEQNVKENFRGSHPYYRLAVIYRKKGQLDNEIRILEKAIKIYENDGPKLQKFKERLQKARELKSKRKA